MLHKLGISKDFLNIILHTLLQEEAESLHVFTHQNSDGVHWKFLTFSPSWSLSLYNKNIEQIKKAQK